MSQDAEDLIRRYMTAFFRANDHIRGGIPRVTHAEGGFVFRYDDPSVPVETFSASGVLDMIRVLDERFARKKVSVQ